MVNRAGTDVPGSTTIIHLDKLADGRQKRVPAVWFEVHKGWDQNILTVKDFLQPLVISATLHWLW